MCAHEPFQFVPDSLLSQLLVSCLFPLWPASSLPLNSLPLGSSLPSEPFRLGPHKRILMGECQPQQEGSRPCLHPSPSAGGLGVGGPSGPSGEASGCSWGTVGCRGGQRDRSAAILRGAGPSPAPAFRAAPGDSAPPKLAGPRGPAPSQAPRPRPPERRRSSAQGCSSPRDLVSSALRGRRGGWGLLPDFRHRSASLRGWQRPQTLVSPLERWPWGLPVPGKGRGRPEPWA